MQVETPFDNLKFKFKTAILFKLLKIMIINNHFKNLKSFYQKLNLFMYKSLQSYTFAVLNIGAPAGGMNAALSAFVRSALFDGHKVLGIRDGFDGLIKNEVTLLFENDSLI